MNKLSRKRLINKRTSKKRNILKGGNQKYLININFKLVNEDNTLNPLDLSPEYLELLLNHLKDLVPSSDDLDLSGTFENEYVLKCNNENEFNMTFIITLKYISEEDDLNMDKIDELFRFMTDMDAPFTSEDEITYFMSHDFDIDRDVKLL